MQVHSFIRSALALLGFLFLWFPTVASAWTPFVVDGRCQKSRRYCRSTVGNRGGAGACCDPASADIETCVRENECVGSYRYRWASSKRPLKWFLAINGMAGKLGYAGITEKQLEDTAKGGFAEWSKPACTTFRSAYAGRTTNPPSGTDSAVTIYFPTSSEWARLGATGALAFATPYSDSTGNIINADIYMNPSPNIRWGVKPVPSNTYDMYHTLTHEIGHAIGLGHSYSTANIMYYSALGSGPSIDKLSPDDTAGICALYPATNACQKDTECAPCFQCQTGKCVAPTFDSARNCIACKTNADCGGSAVCVSAPEGSRCLLKCFGDCCPSGYQCKKIGSDQLCVPFSNHCPRLQCANDALCGANSSCVSNLCQAPATYDYQLCTKECTKDSDCGNALYQCVVYGSGKQRCMAKCPNFMCPLNFSCRQTQQGQHCLPSDQDFCTCRRDQDCTTGRACEENGRKCTPGLGCEKRCISKTGGEIGEPCQPNGALCSTGLRCERLVSGFRCVQECATQTCPAGFICAGGGVNLCVKAKAQNAGETCDGLFLRCVDGLTCSDVNDGSTFCVETCNLSSSCTLGGKCGFERTPQFCECAQESDCSPGYACTSLIGGASVCQCKNPPCQVPCGNGVCEAASGEDCLTCAKDCACQGGFTCTEGFCKPTSRCGDGACEADKGETCGNCAQDCKCGFGAVCSKDKCVRPFCGDGTCHPDSSEDCDRCPEDCGCTSPNKCLAGRCTTDSCGDGKCDGGENCGTCAADCKCTDGKSCANNQCVTPGTCGDNNCDAAKGEDCVTCQQDCGCTDRKVCSKGSCVSADDFCPPAQQNLTCETGDRNCKVTCKEAGCGCQQTSHGQMPAWLLFMMIAWGWMVFRRRAS